MCAKHRKKTNKNVPAKGRLKDMADQLWSIAVREDWAHKCAVCGTSQNVEAHHLIPRQYESTRYVLQNGIALCPSHHKFDPEISPHLNAAGWMQWLEDHHRTLADWYIDRIELGEHRLFTGTKNALHYIGVIQDLRQYTEDDFERVCGVRFSQYLTEEMTA